MNKCGKRSESLLKLPIRIRFEVFSEIHSVPVCCLIAVQFAGNWISKPVGGWSLAGRALVRFLQKMRFFHKLWPEVQCISMSQSNKSPWLFPLALILSEIEIRPCYS